MSEQRPEALLDNDQALAHRVVIHSEPFGLPSSTVVYARCGLGPGNQSDLRFPQWRSCALSRVFAGRYALNRVKVGSSSSWPLRAPGRAALVTLRTGEALCFRMRRLLFFEPSVRLSTILNLQPQWMAYAMPTISRVEGPGLVAFSCESDAEAISGGPGTLRDAGGTADRLIAWSTQSRLRIRGKPTDNNVLTAAAPICQVIESPLVLRSRAAGIAESELGIVGRLLQLVLP